MAVELYKKFFSERAEVLEDLKQTGFWPTTFVSPKSPALALHWHDSEIHGYVISGRTWVTDGETGARLDVEPGDKLVLPAGAIHAEGETPEGMVYIVALPEPRPIQEFLALRSPDDPERPGASR